MRRMLGLAAVAATLALGVVACGGDDNESATPRAAAAAARS